MLNFIVNRRMAVLEYEPEFTSAGWVMRELRSRKQVTISRAFTFREEDVLARPEADDADNQRYRFRFAHRRRGFFVIQGRVLGIRNEVHIADQGLPLERKLFVAERNTGIFCRIAKLKGNGEPIIVGGEAEGAIPIDTFQFLLRKFPNSLELDRCKCASGDDHRRGVWQRCWRSRKLRALPFTKEVGDYRHSVRAIGPAAC